MDNRSSAIVAVISLSILAYWGVVCMVAEYNVKQYKAFKDQLDIREQNEWAVYAIKEMAARVRLHARMIVLSPVFPVSYLVYWIYLAFGSMKRGNWLTEFVKDLF